MTKGVGIYVHIPFCEKKCSYCDFISGSDFTLMESYVKALIREISAYGKKSKGETVDTVYIGGGTPTVLKSGMLTEIMRAVRDNFNTCLTEVTIEGNPNSYPFLLEEILDLKISRASVGVQSLSDNTLTAIGRLHNAESAVKCTEKLVKCGLDVSADLMVGLPHETAEKAAHGAKTLLDIGVGHLSCYALKTEEDTPLHASVKKGEISLPSEDDAVSAYDAVLDACRKYGMERYEISNFCYRGKECHHNIGYWTLAPYIGVGTGASGYYCGERYVNIGSTRGYIDSLTDNRLPVRAAERVEHAAAMYEYVILGLRMKRGVCYAAFKEKFGIDLSDVYGAAIEKNARYLNKGRNLSVKEEFLYCLNSILIDFS